MNTLLVYSVAVVRVLCRRCGKLWTVHFGCSEYAVHRCGMYQRLPHFLDGCFSNLRAKTVSLAHIKYAIEALSTGWGPGCDPISALCSSAGHKIRGGSGVWGVAD
jgi:hypothetical protein